MKKQAHQSVHLCGVAAALLPWAGHVGTEVGGSVSEEVLWSLWRWAGERPVGGAGDIHGPAGSTPLGGKTAEVPPPEL